MTAINRFLAKVHRPAAADQCWVWLASTHGTRVARGCFWDGRKNVDAARWIYQHTHPQAELSGKVVMHRCDNPLCVNPDHLRPGTQADNVLDMHSKRRAHQQKDKAVGKRAASAANATMAADPSRRARGERHGSAKISDEQRRAIETSAERTSILAKRYGLSRTHIQKIRRLAALRARSTMEGLS